MAGKRGRVQGFVFEDCLVIIALLLAAFTVPIFSKRVMIGGIGREGC